MTAVASAAGQLKVTTWHVQLMPRQAGACRDELPFGTAIIQSERAGRISTFSGPQQRPLSSQLQKQTRSPCGFSAVLQLNAHVEQGRRGSSSWSLRLERGDKSSLQHYSCPWRLRKLQEQKVFHGKVCGVTKKSRIAMVAEKGDSISTTISSTMVDPLLSFPGGGMFFYWQLGACASIAKRYDMSRLHMAGASAGALAATLAACQVDGQKAAKAAFQLSLDNHIWDRPGGLQGVWGGLVRQWLQDMLPEDAAQRCSGRLHLYVLHLPSFRSPGFTRAAVTEFASKADVVEACMASVHIPWFMDGRLSTPFRDRRTVDGSILASKEDLALGGERPTVWLDYTSDEEMKKKRWKFLDLGHEGEGPPKTWEWLQEMMARGEQYADELERQGLLEPFHRIRLCDEHNEG